MSILIEVQGSQSAWDCHEDQSDSTNSPIELPNTWYLRGKVVIEFGCALVMSILFAPVIALLAVLVKLTSRGPAIYAQTRLGKDGRPFTIYKLRTMTHNCERVSGAQWSKPGDPRVTVLGKFLRISHLDELPQLWNVLRGDMSLVGPRPERPEFVPSLEQVLPQYRKRLLARPGVTGLAQIQLPPDTDLTSVKRKLNCDLHYVRTLGLWLDIRIVISTAFKLLFVPNWLTCKLLSIPICNATEEATPEVVDEKFGAETMVDVYLDDTLESPPIPTVTSKSE